MRTCEILDSRYGSIILDRNDDGRSFAVSGESIPTSLVIRSGTCDAVRTDVPIGTRDGRHLHLRIGGKEYDLDPSSGKFSRRSYRIRITGHDQQWLFTAATPQSHRLVEGTRYTANNEIGVFTTDDENDVTVEWTEEVRIAGMVAHKVDSTPLTCSLGYVLAASFGTGAQLMLPALFTAAADMLPF
ncbi:hypothetical protein B2J88_48100 [Rhodococcus sp. SRB_17]|nr:hypothetical protein [Rhodococcus sp. SRB_17]